MEDLNFSRDDFCVMPIDNPYKDCHGKHHTAKKEMRAVWISTVLNLDMKAGMTKEQYTAWTRQTLDQLKANKFNTVIYQVRPTNDAMYASDLAPWSSYITGKSKARIQATILLRS